MNLLNKIKASGILRKDYLFVLLFGVMACFYFRPILKKGPLNAHLWRQTDCLSMTHFYAEGTPFLTPEMHAQLADKNTSGVSVGEFPILYYIVGNVWKLFGESYLTYRLFYLFILFAGLFSFYKSLRIVFGDFFLALVLSALLFTSPVYAVYGISFLTDAPAFSFVLVALFFLVKYTQANGRKWLLLSLSFFALAGLIKVSSLMAFFFLFFILFIETLSVKSLKTKKLFRGDIYEWLGFSSVLLVIFSWYYYAESYNAVHQFKYTFNNIYPLWDMEQAKVEPLFYDISIFTSYVFFSRPILVLLFLIGIVNLFLWKKIPPFAYLANLLIIIGSVIYFVLWAPLLGIHDYYYAALLILFVGIFMPFVWFVKSNYPSFFQGYYLKIFLGNFLLYNFAYCFSVVRLKTFAEDGKFPIVGSEKFVALMKWTNYNARANWGRFDLIKPYLEQIGVKKEDKIISLPDDSFNVTLYLTGHKGWTNITPYQTSGEIEYLVQKGAKYLLIDDPELLKQDYLLPFLSNKVGSFMGIEIYQLAE